MWIEFQSGEDMTQVTSAIFTLEHQSVQRKLKIKALSRMLQSIAVSALVAIVAFVWVAPILVKLLIIGFMTGCIFIMGTDWQQIVLAAGLSELLSEGRATVEFTESEE
jgi:hypothetical protein